MISKEKKGVRFGIRNWKRIVTQAVTLVGACQNAALLS